MMHDTSGIIYCQWCVVTVVALYQLLDRTFTRSYIYSKMVLIHAITTGFISGLLAS